MVSKIDLNMIDAGHEVYEDKEQSHELPESDIVSDPLMYWVNRADPVNLNVLKRFILFMRGRVFIGEEQLEGWSGALPIYAFKCSEHGLKVGYPSGWKSILQCPLCLKNILNNG